MDDPADSAKVICWLEDRAAAASLNGRGQLDAARAHEAQAAACMVQARAFFQEGTALERAVEKLRGPLAKGKARR